MNYLGIDYGRRKMGLATGDDGSKLADPFRVMKFKVESEALEKISKLVKELEISKIVLGISEGAMAMESKKFGEKLNKKCKIPVLYQDETLSTADAQNMSIQAGIKRSKRKGMEDAYAASIILQKYLDNL